MPAATMYLRTNDIAAILSLKPRTVRDDIIPYFRARDQVLDLNGRIRVSLKHFAAYLAEMKGTNVHEEMQEIKAFLKDAA